MVFYYFTVCHEYVTTSKTCGDIHLPKQLNYAPMFSRATFTGVSHSCNIVLQRVLDSFQPPQEVLLYLTG